MSIAYNKLQVIIDLDAICHNWQLLNQRSGNAIAVVKSDAYGHGLVETSRALAEAGATTFAVGTVEEALELRQSGVLDPAAHRVISLLGPIDDWEYATLAEHRILPFIGNFAQLSKLAENTARLDAPLPISLKFDTGMSRLGFTLETIGQLLAVLDNAPGLLPVMVSSHLATGDEPGNTAYVTRQSADFLDILTKLSTAGYRVEANLANSGAILAHPDTHHDSQRAGIAMYGTNPFLGTPWEAKGQGLRQAMSVSAPVLDVHTLKQGQCVSYGCTYTAPQDMRIAIIGAGYADCYSRLLTNHASLCLHGTQVPIIGRVCMQMVAVDLRPLDEVGAKQAQVGDSAWLLGGTGDGYVTADQLAAWWGTITYEVFCLLGMNKKQFIQGDIS